MTFRGKHLIALLGSLVFLAAAWHGLELQFGLTNQGQEFGTYGQYNRVLRLVREMPGYEVTGSRLSRRLDWRNLGHLDRFSVDIRDNTGRTGSVEFLRDSPEMQERDPEVLAGIIRDKFNEQVSRPAPPRPPGN